ncbi:MULTISPECIES: type II secretion system F family protein [unclassified Nitratiruptor]|uniref:type II secretion system F family protein n=1 Tax=unclassified Nitratiruptor TaxID=2624044 RepID=UPI001915F8FA|nr:MULTISPECIES: type II secretion system F family protein [unclassified Nitratiruptor]BCD60865.1 general secretion pathway protein F [Nitratiruptor sp. YY08-10]BCD64797.1 general secretion pathway protein F [Nitratiruptor sp. YY08-14]
MKYFKIRYKIGKKKDSIIIEAENRINAIEQFMQMQKGVMLEIKEIPESLWMKLKKWIQSHQSPIKNRPVNLERYIALLDQLAIMLDAGLPLNFSLEEIVKNEKDPMLKAIFTQILEDIESGMSLYASVERFKRQLGTLSLSLFRLGEETGTLSEQVAHLSKIYQEILDNRRKFRKATRYPIFIIVAMSIAFAIVTVMVIPQFEEFFKESGMQLPLPTRFLLWFEHSLIDFGPYILAGAVGISVFLGILYRKNYKAQLFMDKMLLKIMIIGKATLYAMVSRFIYIFKVLHDAGIPMIEAMDIALQIVENRFLQERMRRIAMAIEEGRSLYQGFMESGIFENMVVEMIKAGEVGGGLGKMLQKVNKIYKDRFDYIVDNIAVLIEPILIAAIAGFVLTLALGIFLPMWNLTEVAG